MKNFNDKTVFITGGSSGIGLCAAEILAGMGARTVIFARNKEKLENAQDRICRACSLDKAMTPAYSMDVADNENVKEVLAEAVRKHGAPHVLINCAGRAKPMVFEDVSYEQFDQTMKINLFGARNTIAFLAPYMKKQGEGAIVNVSSMAGLLGVFGYTDYCASKFALIGFSEALKNEFAPCGIAVSVLCPPDTDTPGLEEENITKPEETKAISEGAKVMSPREVAQAMINGIKKEKFLIIPGFDGKLTWLAKRFAPSVVDYVMNRAVKKIQACS